MNGRRKSAKLYQTDIPAPPMTDDSTRVKIVFQRTIALNLRDGPLHGTTVQLKNMRRFVSPTCCAYFSELLRSFCRHVMLDRISTYSVHTIGQKREKLLQ
jgi:hypothetical protein